MAKMKIGASVELPFQLAAYQNGKTGAWQEIETEIESADDAEELRKGLFNKVKSQAEKQVQQILNDAGLGG